MDRCKLVQKQEKLFFFEQRATFLFTFGLIIVKFVSTKN